MNTYSHRNQPFDLLHTRISHGRMGIETPDVSLPDQLRLSFEVVSAAGWVCPGAMLTSSPMHMIQSHESQAIAATVKSTGGNGRVQTTVVPHNQGRTDPCGGLPAVHDRIHRTFGSCFEHGSKLHAWSDCTTSQRRGVDLRIRGVDATHPATTVGIYAIERSRLSILEALLPSYTHCFFRPELPQRDRPIDTRVCPRHRLPALYFRRTA